MAYREIPQRGDLVACLWSNDGGTFRFFEPEKEHRAVLVLRGEHLHADVTDTDPQETGVEPLRVQADDVWGE